ncbi:MAG: ABC-2 family transporter protein [bacterium]|nr:ABC-2 family transporter protein [bacterium]
MRKYLTVFGLSFQNEFVYRLNFIMWRFRNVIRILMTFVLWNSVFSTNKMAFGYTREQMLTYVFLVLVVYAFVASAPSNDNIGGEISSGDLSNYLVKPISYMRYWLTRDWASKLLNIIFAAVETSLLYLWLRPQISLASSPLLIFLGVLMCVLAALIYYFLTKSAIFISFWTPESTWGLMFVVLVLLETLAGVIFPLDILPLWAGKLLQFTPFPYLVYLPIQILLGKFTLMQTLRLLLQAGLWVIGSWYIATKIWKSGQKVYGASGR